MGVTRFAACPRRLALPCSDPIWQLPDVRERPERQVGRKAVRQLAGLVTQGERGGPIHRRGDERLGNREAELTDTERQHEREVGGGGCARVEVGGERYRDPALDELPGRCLIALTEEQHRGRKERRDG